MADSYKKFAICRAIKRKKKNEESRKRKIEAMNGACAAEKAPRASLEAEKRKRYRKRKTEKDEDREEESDKATKELKRTSTRALMVSSKSPPPPRHIISTKRAGSKDASLDPLEELRISTLNRRYPLLSAITAETSVLSGKGKDKNNRGARLVTISVDLTRCLLSEYSWALANRKNLSRSVNLWMSTHDKITDMINENDYRPVNIIINKQGWNTIDDVLREKSYFELLADGCNALFGSDILHNKIFDPNFKTIDCESLVRGDRSATKSFRYITRNVYQPVWKKLSSSINMISGGKGRGGESFIGRGDLATLQSCATVVLEKTSQQKLDKIIKEATARASYYSKFVQATERMSGSNEQQQQPQFHMTPHAMMHHPSFIPGQPTFQQQQQIPYASAIRAPCSSPSRRQQESIVDTANYTSDSPERLTRGTTAASAIETTPLQNSVKVSPKSQHTPISDSLFPEPSISQSLALATKIFNGVATESEETLDNIEYISQENIFQQEQQSVPNASAPSTSAAAAVDASGTAISHVGFLVSTPETTKEDLSGGQGTPAVEKRKFLENDIQRKIYRIVPSDEEDSPHEEMSASYEEDF